MQVKGVRATDDNYTRDRQTHNDTDSMSFSFMMLE